MLPNEKQSFISREPGTEGQAAQLGQKRVAVFNAQVPLEHPVFIFDGNGLGHVCIQKRGVFRSPRLCFSFIEDFFDAVH